MDKHELFDIRQKRLQQYIERHFGKRRGNIKAFAARVGAEANYVSRMLSKGKNRKNFGEELAREWEALLRLRPFWFDNLGGPNEPRSRRHDEMSLSDTGILIGLTADQAPPSVRKQILEIVRSIVDVHRKTEHPEPPLADERTRPQPQ